MTDRQRNANWLRNMIRQDIAVRFEVAKILDISPNVVEMIAMGQRKLRLARWQMVWRKLGEWCTKTGRSYLME